MDTEIQHYITSQPNDRQKIFTDLHGLILKNDKNVTPVVGPMMGMQMIIYKGKHMMKYALAGMKTHMSLHLLPMYMSPALYNKFKEQLSNASFQKGCINFTSAEQMPSAIVAGLIKDCSAIDHEKIREQSLLERKLAKKTAAPKNKDPKSPVKKPAAKTAAIKKSAGK